MKSWEFAGVEHDRFVGEALRYQPHRIIQGPWNDSVGFTSEQVEEAGQAIAWCWMCLHW
jgi:hypothetical protein